MSTDLWSLRPEFRALLQPYPRQLRKSGYAYARDICATEQIHSVLCGDANFRRLCGGEFPGESYLRRFRRHNRTAITHCLSVVLGFLGVRVQANTPTDQAAHQPSGSPASEGLPGQNPNLVEAQRRIDKAILLDMVE